ncbi:hypothetical protein EYC80_008166 [Monilinia laxa]|uniref:Sur7 protein n=2 Tax=Monilinia laxa TaxID=61186 RepID=A0A5N6JUE4_MONLA|nr:hypothetical protein EYC80_008166 [Monilinia laxa]
MQPLASIPMVCSTVTFVLAMLCLFAGNKPGFMEDYHIVTLNTSEVGQNLIPTKTSGSDSTPTSISVGGIVSSLSSISPAGIVSGLSGLIPREPGIGDDIANALGDIENGIADKVAKTLGIQDWYSLHLMDMCEGTYTPNATANGAGLNVSSCTNQTAMYHFDINSIISEQLSIGPLHLNLSDINWPSAIQDGLDTLSTALNATFVFYCIGSAAAGLAVLTSLAAIFITSRLFSFLNWGLASLGLFALGIASIIVTVLQNKAAHIINKFGNDIGLYAYKGHKYLVLTWVATAFIAVAAIAWIGIFFLGRRQEGNNFHEKYHFGKRSRQSGSSEFARRGA